MGYPSQKIICPQTWCPNFWCWRVGLLYLKERISAFKWECPLDRLTQGRLHRGPPCGLWSMAEVGDGQLGYDSPNRTLKPTWRWASGELVLSFPKGIALVLERPASLTGIKRKSPQLSKQTRCQDKVRSLSMALSPSCPTSCCLKKILWILNLFLHF